jgi:hypothetical protein
VGGGDSFTRAMDWYDGEATSPESGTSTSAVVHGTIDIGIRASTPDAEHTIAVIEYGTVPVMDVLNAVRADNWLYIRGDIDADLGKRIKKQIRDAFYCDHEDWKNMLWERGRSTVTKALAGLKKQSAS